MPPPQPVLLDELVEEVLFRLPPDEPAWLVRASAVCKPWRCILADPGFRRRYREFHRTPPFLGFFDDETFVPTSALLPVQPGRPGLVSLDCRHGRALFFNRYTDEPSELIVLDPLTGQRCRVPLPDLFAFTYSAAVLCAAEGCDHHGCQGGHFLVAFVSTDMEDKVTSACLYSSETGAWSGLTSLHHPNFGCHGAMGVFSVLVGDALYFSIGGILNYQLGTSRLSTFENPVNCDGSLMTAEDGGLGFAALLDATNLALWSMKTGPKGALEWAKLRAIDLKILLPDGDLSIPTHKHAISRWTGAFVRGSMEGTQIIFVNTYVGCYMVDLKSGRARKVSCGYGVVLFPYMSFYIPAMEAASTGRGQ